MPRRVAWYTRGGPSTLRTAPVFTASGVQALGFVDKESDKDEWSFKLLVGEENAPIVLSGTSTTAVLAQIAVSAAIRELQSSTVELDRTTAR